MANWCVSFFAAVPQLTLAEDFLPSTNLKFWCGAFLSSFRKELKALIAGYAWDVIIIIIIILSAALRG